MKLNLCADMSQLGVHWRAWANFQTGTWSVSNRAFDTNLVVNTREEDGKKFVESIFCIETGGYVRGIPFYLAEKDAYNYYLHLLINENGVGFTGHLKKNDKGLN